MTETLGVPILLLGDEADCRRWKSALSESHTIDELDLSTIAAPAPLLIVAAASHLARVAEIAQHHGAIGLLVIGGSESPGPSSDARLPVDATDRELRLACELLAEIARLRHRERAASAARRQLEDLVQRDPLTGLLNRRAWDDQLAARWKTQPAGQGLCVAIVDLDTFKPINDDFGHTVGDRALQAAAAALIDSFRPTDFVARLGGDEFGLLICGVDAQQAAAVLGRVHARLRDELSQVAPRPITASIGYRHVAADDPLRTPEQATHAADEALRRAKQSGRDRICDI